MLDSRNHSPTDEAARVNRRPMAARMQCFRLMRPLTASSYMPMQQTRPAHERINAPLISAANQTTCLPPNGYMDVATTYTIVFVHRATERRTARRIAPPNRRIDFA
jgi:hypothetical protein